MARDRETPQTIGAFGALPQLRMVVSGGQTGVDRAALDWAIAAGAAHGGWCPRGRLAEDGTIPASYLLRETRSADYAERTRRNVRDSEATLILNVGPVDGGTKLTAEYVLALGRPCRIVQLDDPAQHADVAAVAAWLRDGCIDVLNVAGPRESKRPGIGAQAAAYLVRLARP